MQEMKYILNGDKLFNITLINTIRDGGTQVIKTTWKSFYINKDTHEFHSSYPLSIDNLIIDIDLIDYIIDKIDSYIKNQENEIDRLKVKLDLYKKKRK